MFSKYQIQNQFTHRLILNKQLQEHQIQGTPVMPIYRFLWELK